MYIIIYKYCHMYFGYELQKKQFRKLYYQNYETMTDRWQKMVIVMTMVMVMRMMNGDGSDDGELCEERRSRILEWLWSRYQWLARAQDGWNLYQLLNSIIIVNSVIMLIQELLRSIYSPPTSRVSYGRSEGQRGEKTGERHGTTNSQIFLFFKLAQNYHHLDIHIRINTALKNNSWIERPAKHPAVLST